MKVIVAGSRNLQGVELVDKAVKASGFLITELVSGKAPGIDTYAENWARFRGIPIKEFAAKWDDLHKKDAMFTESTNLPRPSCALCELLKVDYDR